MKKDEAVAAIERAGITINDLSARVWTTAFNPSAHGWGQSLLSLRRSPLSCGDDRTLVTSVVVKGS